jgi:hypothetical protein
MRQVIALGRSQLWYVGPYEFPRAPWNVDFIGGKIVYGFGIEPGQDTSAALDFKLSADATLNQTEIGVRRTKGGVLEPGMMLSLFGRLHVITALPGGDPGTPGQQGPAGDLTVGVRPWLRGDYAAGTPIEFAKPFGTMRLASDDTGAMELQLSRYGTVTVDLVEAF